MASTQEELDTYDEGVNFFMSQQLRERSTIAKIVVVKELIIVLAFSGLCTVFSSITNRRMCFLNTYPDEEVTSVFYNVKDESLIKVVRRGTCIAGLLRCKSVPMEDIRRNPLGVNDGAILFGESTLADLYDVQFCDVNHIAVIYCKNEHVFKVYKLKNYTLLYCIPEGDIGVITTSPGLLVATSKVTSRTLYVEVKILDVQNGQELKYFRHKLLARKKEAIYELIDHKFLVHQYEENLQIVDLQKEDQVLELSSFNSKSGSFIYFLHGK